MDISKIVADALGIEAPKKENLPTVIEKKEEKASLPENPPTMWRGTMNVQSDRSYVKYFTVPPMRMSVQDVETMCVQVEPETMKTQTMTFTPEQVYTHNKLEEFMHVHYHRMYDGNTGDIINKIEEKFSNAPAQVLEAVISVIDKLMKVEYADKNKALLLFLIRTYCQHKLNAIKARTNENTRYDKLKGIY